MKDREISHDMMKNKNIPFVKFKFSFPNTEMDIIVHKTHLMNVFF
jgi:hypothetical protein